MIDQPWDVSYLAPGGTLHVQVFKADGGPHRFWITTVERMEPGLLVTWSPPGHLVHDYSRLGADGQPSRRDWLSHWGIRAFYWPGRPYNLLEVYHPDGRLEELYAHIASPPTLTGNLLTWTDHELDVVLHADGRLEIADEDEFAAAVLAFSYSPEFQASCYQAVQIATALLHTWTPTLPPATEQ